MAFDCQELKGLLTYLLTYNDFFIGRCVLYIRLQSRRSWRTSVLADVSRCSQFTVLRTVVIFNCFDVRKRSWVTTWHCLLRLKFSNKKHLKNVGPIRHSEPPHANSPDVASGTVARRMRIDVHDDNDDNDNAWQRGPLWPHGMGPKLHTHCVHNNVTYERWIFGDTVECRRWFISVKYFTRIQDRVQCELTLLCDSWESFAYIIRATVFFSCVLFLSCHCYKLVIPCSLQNTLKSITKIC